MAKTAFECFDINCFVFCDVSEGMLNIAKERYSDIGNVSEFYHTELCDIEFNNEFDAVTCIQVNHYLHDQERKKSIENCYNALKDGGIFITFENIAPFTTNGEKLFLRRWLDYQTASGKTQMQAEAHINRYNKSYFPITVGGQLSVLYKCGFNVAEVFWLSYMQAGFIAKNKLYEGVNWMIYNDFQDLKLSALGMGAMRLPVIAGSDSKIDEQMTAEMVDYAMGHGINYYDTAWGYHGGNSELVMGRVLKKYPRESFYLATKFPGYDLSNMGKIEEIFERQLEKCQVDYFDFYLFHNVCESNIDAYLNTDYGIHDYLLKQKENGRIRHLGFSAHGDYNVMKRFLECYGESMEFCQIQLNYIDYTFQNAKQKLELLAEYNIPVWVMEPVRGGKLASLSPSNEKKLTALRPDEKIPAWAFRFLQSIDSVVVTLSGMSNFQQLSDNIKTYEESKPLNKVEMAAILDVADSMIKRKALACTSCHYCVDHCPKGLDIPKLIELYNEHCLTGGGFIAPMVVSSLEPDKRPDACIGCRSCEAVCPQQIKISDAMSDFAKRLK